MKKWKIAVMAMGFFVFSICLNPATESVHAAEVQTSESQTDESQVPETQSSDGQMQTYEAGAESYSIQSQAIKNGLTTENGKIYFYENGSRVANQEKYIDNKWYYFQQDGSAVVNNWHSFSNKTCYYDGNGHMVHGLYTINGKVYGFDEWSGALLTGEHYFTDGSSDQWYYFYEDNANGHVKGQMATGWVVHHGNQYYYNPNGEMAHRIYTVELDGKTYGFNEWTGVLLTGEHYFTDGSSDQWYYFYEDNANGHVKGQMATGWVKHHNKQYYYNPNGAMAHGLAVIDGKTYGFDEWTGVQILGEHNFTDTVNNDWYYFNPSNGVMATGWTQYNGHTYYFENDGKMYHGEKYIDGNWYYFDQWTGIMATGWTDHHNHHYFYNMDGTMVHGEMYLSGNWYYFDQDTGIMATGWTYHSGNTYYYDGNGRMVHGRYTVDGVTYNFDEWTGVLKTGWRYENGYKVFYNADGTLCQNVESLIGKQSSYYLKVNTSTNTVTVFAKDGANGYIIPVKKMICSTGLPATPTIKGTFTLRRAGRWYTLMGPVYGQYVTQISGPYFFHSAWYHVNGNIRSLSVSEYRKLGNNASHGCVRLTVADAKWIYDNCNGSTVYIYSGADTDPLSKPTRPNPVVISGDWGYDPTDPAIR